MLEIFYSDTLTVRLSRTGFWRLKMLCWNWKNYRDRTRKMWSSIYEWNRERNRWILRTDITRRLKNWMNIGIISLMGLDMTVKSIWMIFRRDIWKNRRYCSKSWRSRIRRSLRNLRSCSVYISRGNSWVGIRCI